MGMKFEWRNFGGIKIERARKSKMLYHMNRNAARSAAKIFAINYHKNAARSAEKILKLDIELLNQNRKLSVILKML